VNDVGDVDRMSVGRYVSVLHSALRLWKVFYVLSSKIRTPGHGREASREQALFMFVVRRGGDDKPHKGTGRALIFSFRWGTDSYEDQSW
jgi:hypothetical protein